MEVTSQSDLRLDYGHHQPGHISARSIMPLLKMGRIPPPPLSRNVTVKQSKKILYRNLNDYKQNIHGYIFLTSSTHFWHDSSSAVGFLPFSAYLQSHRHAATCYLELQRLLWTLRLWAPSGCLGSHSSQAYGTCCLS